MNQSRLIDPVLVESHPVVALSEDRPRLAASLLAFQAATYIVTAIEAAAMSAVSGNAAGRGPVVLSLLLAIALLRCGHRVRQNRPWRRVRVLESSLLGWAGIDLALAGFLTNTGLGLLPTITRIGIPLAVVVLLSRKHVS
jgi:hypothetical protein